MNAPSPSSYPAREGLNLGTGGAGITAGLGNRGVETGEAETGTEGEPGAAGDGIATDPTTDEEGRASIEVSSPKGRGWTFIKGKHKSRGRKKAAGEEQEHEKEGYRRWEMSATGSVDFGALVPDAPDSENSDGEAMVVGDIDVDIEGKGEGTVRWKGRGEKDGKDRAKRESGGEVLEFVRARGSDDGTGVGKRGSASVTRETVEEEKEDVEVDKVGVEAIREDADAVVAGAFLILCYTLPYSFATRSIFCPPTRPSLRPRLRLQHQTIHSVSSIKYRLPFERQVSRTAEQGARLVCAIQPELWYGRLGSRKECTDEPETYAVCRVPL